MLFKVPSNPSHSTGQVLAQLPISQCFSEEEAGCPASQLHCAPCTEQTQQHETTGTAVCASLGRVYSTLIGFINVNRVSISATTAHRLAQPKTTDVVFITEQHLTAQWSNAPQHCHVGTHPQSPPRQGAYSPCPALVQPR